jgi:membrane associated rhomboid family serine protease
MRQPPSPADCLRYPITTCVAVLAIVATLQSPNGNNINPAFLCPTGDCLLEPWRLLTSTLFHRGPLHLIFNLYWLWVFGSVIEGRFGHAVTLCIYVLFAAGSSAAELAVLYGGVGLSGVVYGLFGMLWALSGRDPRLRDALDQQTIQLMVAWFFICIVLTITHIFGVANVAHGVGCLLGLLLGWTIGSRGLELRLQRGAILAAVFLLCIAGGTVARPYVNLSGSVAPDFAYRGYLALKKGDDRQAAAMYEKAINIDPRVFGWWNNLGIAYINLGRGTDAEDAFRHARALKPDRGESE